MWWWVSIVTPNDPHIVPCAPRVVLLGPRGQDGDDGDDGDDVVIGSYGGPVR